MKKRTPQEIIEDIQELVKCEGYIYALCLILFEDFHINLETIHKVDHKAKLSIKETTFLLGFFVQNEINLTPPQEPEYLFELKENTYKLMEELHFSYNVPMLDKLSKMFQQVQQGKAIEIEDHFQHMYDFFVKDGGMVEPMFYSGDGVYDFQYLEYLEKKYQYDKIWLLQHKNIDINNTIDIVKQIKHILQTKSKQVNLIGIREVIPDIYSKIEKAGKGKLSNKEIEDEKRNALISTELYQYINLFPPKPEIQNIDDIDVARENSWNTFYKNLLSLFVIPKEDLKESPSFIEHFSFRPSININKDYISFGSFNILNSKPLIEIEKDSYFIPISYLVYEAIYEAPFYWMMEDKAYRNTLAINRGKTGEEMTYELLSRVFGETNTFKSVKIEIQRGHQATDIDVLCILGNKALCVQVKSKKLTLLSKKGDEKQLEIDFKGAVQDAYDQGLVSRTFILDNNATFYKEDTSELELPESIDEVFILGVTTENYPALAHQAHIMLKKEGNEPNPLFLTIFDLELLVHYLNQPHDFLYYIRQRTTLIDYFRAGEEMIYLGYHLKHKLWKRKESDGILLDSDYGYLIDRNYYPLKAGFSHLVSDENDPIKNVWKDEKFDILYKELCRFKAPKTVDIIFHLFDWSVKGRSDLASYIIETRNKTKINKETHSITTATSDMENSSFGIAYISLGTNNIIELREKVQTLSKARKYRNKCDFWLGIGSLVDSPNLIDFMCYSDTTWKYDESLEKFTKEILDNNPNRKIISLDGRRKIGRNDPCPCGSGRKYKKCCLK